MDSTELGEPNFELEQKRESEMLCCVKFENFGVQGWKYKNKSQM